MNDALEVLDSCYIDPAPASPMELTGEAMRVANGGEAITFIIVTCNEELGVVTVVVVGEVVVTIAT